MLPEKFNSQRTIYDRRELVDLDLSTFASTFLDEASKVPVVPPITESLKYSRDENFLPRTFSEFLKKGSTGIAELFQQIFNSSKEAQVLLEEDITPSSLEQLQKLYPDKITPGQKRQLEFLRRAYAPKVA